MKNPKCAGSVESPLIKRVTEREFMKDKSQKKRGSISFEWIVITTLLVIGLISGLGALRNSIVEKLDDLTTSVENLNTAASQQAGTTAKQTL